MRHNTSIFITSFLFIVLLLSSCGEDDTSNPPGNSSFIGDFVSAAHTTRGTASIDQNETTMTLTDFKTDSGPDLNIYLASSETNVTSDFIDLGDIKGVDGSYTYTLPGSTDYTKYKYVIVWCVAFNVNFGYAILVMQ